MPSYRITDCGREAFLILLASIAIMTMTLVLGCSAAPIREPVELPKNCQNTIHGILCFVPCQGPNADLKECRR